MSNGFLLFSFFIACFWRLKKFVNEWNRCFILLYFVVQYLKCQRYCICIHVRKFCNSENEEIFWDYAEYITCTICICVYNYIKIQHIKTDTVVTLTIIHIPTTNIRLTRIVNPGQLSENKGGGGAYGLWAPVMRVQRRNAFYFKCCMLT